MKFYTLFLNKIPSFNLFKTLLHFSLSKTESVRRAVTATGLAAVAPLEVVTEAAAADIGVQSAYRDLLRSSVQSTIQDNEEFTPDRFPNASNYFNKQ